MCFVVLRKPFECRFSILRILNIRCQVRHVKYWWIPYTDSVVVTLVDEVAADAQPE